MSLASPRNSSLTLRASRYSTSILLAGWLLSLGIPLAASAQEKQKPPEKVYSPRVLPASDEGEKAIKRFKAPEGFEVRLFAAEPHLANPVAFCIDAQGKFYVAETFRHSDGATDTRGHMYWLDDDLACRTVEDRVAMFRKHLKDKFNTYSIEHDRVRLVEDRDGDGRADTASVFADGFNTPASGIGAGLLARGGNVWYACIPDLWQLRDTNGDGQADVRQSLHYGYGVHVGFIGHDLHGLCFGPDGKLYFSIGDRGINVQTEGRTLAYPDMGLVLRCNPDGSELEVFAQGLRNPQELAFDQYGNLFTCDNNSDGGDRARWVYLVEGGDSGWRIGYQFHDKPTGRGPWNAEKLWHPHWDGQAAYLLPPLLNFADGPSGLCYYPGTGLPSRYNEHFFLADFRGGSGNSGIRSLAMKPKGASFEMVDQHEFVWSILATDVDFGPDGAMYISDWTEGWSKPGKGRIYKVAYPGLEKDPTVLEVKKLLNAGLAGRKVEELTALLQHPDLRIRQEAQFTLADAGAAPIDPFAKVARESKHTLARIHALWGLGQIGRKSPKALEPVLGLLADPDPEVRAQAAKVLGEGRVAAAVPKILPLLKDDSSRVRFFAAMALGKLGKSEAVEPVLEMVRANADQDLYLRHAGVMALTGIHDDKAMAAATRDPSAAVRMAVLLAMRRLERPEVATFLADLDPKLVVEAARAINDMPIDKAMPQLAALITRSGLSDPALRRALNANFRLGQPEHAAALAALAARSDVEDSLRIEALAMLGEWAKPSGRDHVLGLWRPLEPRSQDVAVQALRPALAGILGAPDKVRQAGTQLAGRFGITEVGPLLLAQLTDAKSSSAARVTALTALEALKDSKLSQAMKLAVADADPAVRGAGRRVMAKLDPAQALGALRGVLDQGALVERQSALATLSAMNDPEADQLLSQWLDKLLSGEVPPELHLDLLESTAGRKTSNIPGKLARFEAARAKDDPLAKYRESLSGGDAERGRQIFFQRAQVSCQRCHKIMGQGGEVGPDLTEIGGKQKRDYLLESLVDPNRTIAKGFDTVVIETSAGQALVGILKEEDDKQLKLMTAEGKLLVIPKSEIEDRSRGKSAMPETLLPHLSKSDIRDLVEFLSMLKK